MLGLALAATIALSNPLPATAETFTMEATAYVDRGPTKFGGWDTPAGPGIVAIDPKVIEPWSKLYIEGYGEALAVDTGGKIKGYKIDVWMDKRQDALQWGRHKVQVTILRRGSGQANAASRGSQAVEVYKEPTGRQESGFVSGGYQSRIPRTHVFGSDFNIGLVHKPREPLQSIRPCHRGVIYWSGNCN
jgi:3D (Asp-Asp-Asp) domain-containing protein